MSLENYTDKQLEEELEHRKIIQQDAELSDIPEQLEKIDLDPLRKICQNYIDFIAKNNYRNEDDIHYIYEVAMETFFGKKVWNWINKKLR